MPKLVFHDSDGIDRTIDLGSEPTLIGRATDCQVQTQDAMVSRRHARIIWDGGYWIEDLGSSNGVYVGNERVQKAPLRPGDEVRCGSLVLKLIPDLTRPVQRNTPPVDPMANPANKRMTGNFSAQSLPPPSYDDAPPSYEPPPALPPDEEFGAPPAYAPPPPYEPPQAFDDDPPPPASNARRSPPPSSSGTGTNTGAMSPEAHAERARRIAAEAAVLTAEQRAATAEGKLYEYEQQISDLTTRCNAAEAQTQLATKRAGDLETTAREGDRRRRQVDQLKADIRRLRGGAAVDDPEVKEVGGADSAAIAAERDRLRQRVTDLEAEVSRLEASGGRGAPAPTGPVDIQVPGGGDAALKRKVDQLTAEIRRLRGGGAPADDGARVAELEARVAKAEQERDQALARANDSATAQSLPVDNSAETGKLKRMLEQLTAENRRLRAAGGAPPAGEDPRVAELTARVAEVERERDAAKAAPRPAAAAATDPGAASATEAMNDALSDLRGSLRAANDEIGVLGVEAPGDSVTVLKDALTAANEQLEGARTQLKNLKKALKLP